MLNRQCLCFKWGEGSPKGTKGKFLRGGKSILPPLVERPALQKVIDRKQDGFSQTCFSEQSPVVNMKIVFPDGVDGEDGGGNRGTSPRCLTDRENACKWGYNNFIMLLWELNEINYGNCLSR